MILTLDDYTLADGMSREARVLGEDSFTLTQDTDTVALLRAAWLTGFPSRAMRSIPLTYRVTFPPCAGLAAALEEARRIPIECPKGGVLVELYGATAITFSSAWVQSVTATRRGVTNEFLFSLTAVNPDITARSRLALMNADYIANLNDITGLTGGTSTKLDSLSTADVAVGFTATLFVAINGLNQLATFRLYAGTDATNTDPNAGPVIVRPTDYNAGTNAKVWKRLDA